MITYKGKMYNVTAEEFIDERPRDYSIGYYRGTAIIPGDDGTIRTDIPYSSFDFSGNNIGIQIEYEAKEYFKQHSVFPILRIYTSSEMDTYYLEWDPANPTGFNVSSPGRFLRWESCYQWDSSIPEYPSQYARPRVFVSVSTKEELETLAIVWSGSVTTPGESDTSTLIAYATFQFNVTDSSFIKSTNGETIGQIRASRYPLDQGRDIRIRTNIKIDNGPAIFFYINGNAWLGLVGIAPIASNNSPLPPFKPLYNTINDSSGSGPSNYRGKFTYDGVDWGTFYHHWWTTSDFKYYNIDFVNVPIFETADTVNTDTIARIFSQIGVSITYVHDSIYYYLLGTFTPVPPSDVDPEDIPPEDEPPTPIPPDDQDPYYDPTSDPESPDYDPTKDPDNPQYDPTEPHTPYRPPSEPSDPPVQQEQPPVDPIPTPETPPSYVTTNAMFTLYNPSGGDLTNLANFLWSPTWSIDTFKKIFANPLDCILGLMVMPHLSATVATKTMNVGNISTGVTMHYFTSQFYDFDCGTFELMEYYNSYLDYAPYTKVDIFLPYIGDKQLSTDEVMNKTLGVKYRFDLATGDCVAFITVDGTVLYQFSGNCAARLPLAGNNWNGIIPAITGVAISAGSMAAGLPALGAASAAAVSTMKETISHTGGLSGSAGLMGVQKPYLIVTRPRQALPRSQNSFTGYPSFITESLGSLTGYTEVEQCHLEHVPATGAELEEIERLLKEGVLF